MSNRSSTQISNREFVVQVSHCETIDGIGRLFVGSKCTVARLFLQPGDESFQRHGAPAHLLGYDLIYWNHCGLEIGHLLKSLFAQRGIVAAVVADLIEDGALEQV